MKIETAFIAVAVTAVLCMVCLGQVVTELSEYMNRAPAVCIAVPICGLLAMLLVGAVAQYTASKV